MARTCSIIIISVVATVLLSMVLTTQLGVRLAISRPAATSPLNDRLFQIEKALREIKHALADNTSAPLMTSVLTANPETHLDGPFLVAAEEACPDVQSGLRLLKSLLGLARLLHRTAVLPRALCECDPSRQSCTAVIDRPFGCPLRREVRDALNLEQWAAGSVPHTPLHSSSPLVSAHFLTPHSRLPKNLTRSHVRVLLPDGMSDSETRYALRSYGDTRILEIERTDKAYCGWDQRHDQIGEGARFEALVGALFVHSPSLVQCLHFHGGAGEVQRFTNLGTLGDVHDVSAPFEALPQSVRSLPNGSDLVITFATGSVAIMALNWAKAARRAGIDDILIGALDESMMEACARETQPCVLIRGGAISAELTSNSVATNLRSRPSLYPKMSVLKVGFYRELLSYGFNVWACDADAVLTGDPRPLMRQPEWVAAHVAAATDCIDIPLDNIRPLLHCDLNTGLVFMRSTPEVIEFTLRWRETIASAKELRIRDQAAFNMILKHRRLTPQRHRLFTASNGPTSLTLGVLPLSRFLNGHTFFVQHAHELPEAQPPLAVHMTYQFAEGSRFAHGKRQRLRHAGLWLVDDSSYFNGRYVAVAPASATLRVTPLSPRIGSKEAIGYHLREARHRARVLRALLGIAKALNRDVILPRMLCYCDFMWKEMKACRVGGAETMRLPFDCPMDHVLDTPKWFELIGRLGGPTVREPAFLQSPRVPANVSGSIAKGVNLGANALSARDIRAALAPHATKAVIEFAFVDNIFCGFEDTSEDRAFVDATMELLHYHRSPFCYEDGVSAPPYSQCCHPRKPGDAFFPCVHGFDPPDPLPVCGAQRHSQADWGSA